MPRISRPKRSVVVQTCVTPAEREMLEKLAEQEGMSLSTFMRRLLRQAGNWHRIEPVAESPIGMTTA